MTDSKKSSKPLPVSLRGLILFVVLASVMATLCNSLVVAYRVQRDALTHAVLESNSAYAAKVASSIGEFLRATHNNLNYSARVLGEHWNDPEVLREEALRLEAQDQYFNSIEILDANGKVLASNPPAAQIVGSNVPPSSVVQALKERRALVSSTYVSHKGNLIVFVSEPVFSKTGAYLGAVVGSIYLLDQSALHTVISSHFHHEGTFAFVADGKRRLLYHPNPKRIAEVLVENAAVDAALSGKRGSMEIRNSQGTEMLAGYAQVPDANWAVVVQQPREHSQAILRRLMHDMIMGMIPASLLGMVLVLVGTSLIARPLRLLSAAAQQLSAPHTTEQLQRINAWYHDASAIRQAMLTGVQLLQQKLGMLSHEAQSDPLTGLANRRAMNDMLNLLVQTNQPYSVLALDIDHFKRVNDTFGHDAGDVALKKVAEILKHNSRANDLACRSGGEEFSLILPDASQETASAIAERIRENIADSEITGVGKLTISIGVASKGLEPVTPQAVLKLADERLYRAKESGRNKVVAA